MITLNSTHIAWTQILETLRQKRRFLVTITILILANIWIWLDVLRGCAVQP